MYWAKVVCCELNFSPQFSWCIFRTGLCNYFELFVHEVFVTLEKKILQNYSVYLE